MPVSFSFSSDPQAHLGQTQIKCAQTLAEIEKAIERSECGEGSTLPDGSLHIDFQLFVIVLKPDGSFHGMRKTRAGERASPSA